MLLAGISFVTPKESLAQDQNLFARVQALEAAVATLQSQVAALQTALAAETAARQAADAALQNAINAETAARQAADAALEAAIDAGPGFSGWEFVFATEPPRVNNQNVFDSRDDKGVEARCSPGKMVIGGGASQGVGLFAFGDPGDHQRIRLVDSRPAFDGRGWVVRYNENPPPLDTPATWHAVAYAICADVQ